MIYYISQRMMNARPLRWPAPPSGPPHGISYNVGRWCCMLIEATVIVGVGFVGDRRGGGIWGDGMWGKRMASVQ